MEKQIIFEVANIYNYIDSKEALLENYVLGISEEFTTYMNNIIDSSFSQKSKRNNYLTKLSLIIEEGIEKGEFRPMNVEIATNSIVSSLRWSNNKYVDNTKTPINPIELEKQIMDFVFLGVCTDK